jgi:EAL domain-containing protein (putative c-di-GMP-specific phosphodiesterase class I)
MLARKPTQREELPQQEELLLDYAERLERHVAGRRAVHIHMSALQPHNRRPQHVRIAASSFDALIKRHEGQLFLLANSDFVVVLRDIKIAAIDDVVLKLRFLFADDPLIAREDADEGGDVKFCTWYDMRRDYPAFLDMARHMHKFGTDDLGRGVNSRLEPGDDEAAAKEPLTPATLHRLEGALNGADVSALIRRQPVCAVIPGAPAKAVFNEVFVSIADLRRKMLPNVDLASNRWLFQHLTMTLDERMLRLLPEIERGNDVPTSLNLNLDTVLSDRFLEFDRELRSHTGKSMVVEFQSMDLFGNIGSYRFAREFLRERGYKACLDGLNYLTFPVLNKAELDLDLVKIGWAQGLLGEAGEGRLKLFIDAVRQNNGKRIVLTRCDDIKAVKFGHELGISLFQGRFIDDILKTGEIV